MTEIGIDTDQWIDGGEYLWPAGAVQNIRTSVDLSSISFPQKGVEPLSFCREAIQTGQANSASELSELLSRSGYGITGINVENDLFDELKRAA